MNNQTNCKYISLYFIDYFYIFLKCLCSMRDFYVNIAPFFFSFSNLLNSLFYITV